MNYNPYCPHCGVELDFDDHYDMYDDGDIIIVKAYGHCSCCKTKYRWEDIYSLTGFRDVEEDE